MIPFERLKAEAEAIHLEDKQLRQSDGEKSDAIADELLWLMSRGGRGRIVGRPLPGRFLVNPDKE